MSTNIHFISAGAGSGKTYRLTEKLKELLSNPESNVTPSGVIATTFTKLAAGELQERVRGALIEEGQTLVANQMEQALIGTVNSVCGEIIRRFAFEAGMPPDQQVVDEAQGDVLFYQAMEQALASNKHALRQMNSLCHRLQITDQQTKQQLWRQEIKKIVDAARANNQTADDIRHLGKESADKLLAHFPNPSTRNLDKELLGAVNQALAIIDTEVDKTKSTRSFISKLNGAQAALIHHRLTWPDWISFSKANVGAKSRDHVQPIIDIASEFTAHSQLQDDLRSFTVEAFIIAADSLTMYQEMKRQKGLIDFVDQEQRLYQLLDNPVVASTIGQELQLLMVDEFQDTSPIQLALFLKLSRLADQVIWVGDIKQSIYGFRGSDPTLMDAVVNAVIEEGNPPEILENSWRSSPELVTYSNNLFVPAFADSLTAEQVALHPKRDSMADQPAVELWRLQGRRKDQRARALAKGLLSLMKSGRQVIDKHSKDLRQLEYGDLAILCRTHSNLGEVASALADAKLPIRYKRPGLLDTPECCLALACLRRLIDPLDTLASAEIHSLITCEHPEEWIAQRMKHLHEPDPQLYSWLEDETGGPIAALKEQRVRLPFLTPVETLRLAIDTTGVREAVYRWGPTEQLSQHRLNNLAALLDHAQDYLDQCNAQNEPATAPGLVLWLRALNDAKDDTQAAGGDENAIQLVTNHGAKGLEWPVVIAMDLHSKLKPRLWGLSVIPAPETISLDNPLANRTLRYWPQFFGNHSANIDLLDKIASSPEGQIALEQEIQESKRLLYVTLTRPRDNLIFTMENNAVNGPWMDTLNADWMLPDGETLTLPDKTIIPSNTIELTEEGIEAELPVYQPTWLQSTRRRSEMLRLRQSPSSMPPIEGAKIGETIDLGDRLEIDGSYDPIIIGSALHAAIAATIMGQNATERILVDHGLQKTINVEIVDKCTQQLLEVLEDRFSPTAWYTEYPLSFTTESGQVVSGWIDLLLESEDGFVLIDHKASQRKQQDLKEIALEYSGQLNAYASGIRLTQSKPLISKWIHFAALGTLIEVR